MKTLLRSLILAVYIFTHFVCTASEDCKEIGGVVPVSVFNSPYTILPNGSLCCPEYIGDSCNRDEKEIATKCPGELVYEPCYFCKTCAKQLGESCGGNQGQYGKCDEELECITQNITTQEGLCYVKGTCCLYNGMPAHTCSVSLPSANCNGVSFLCITLIEQINVYSKSIVNVHTNIL